LQKDCQTFHSKKLEKRKLELDEVAEKSPQQQQSIAQNNYASIALSPTLHVE
jgi:hypothetical protein